MNTKEAIERVRRRFNKWALDNEDLTALQVLGLADVESEDERIRKYLIAALKCAKTNRGTVYIGNEDLDEYISYLEKQKEQKYYWKPTDEQMEVLFKANPVNLMPDELRVYYSLCNDLKKYSYVL